LTRTAKAGIVLVGSGEREAATAQKMRHALRAATPVDLTDATELRETMGVLKHLSLFSLATTPGVTHLAAGLGAPRFRCSARHRRANGATAAVVPALSPRRTATSTRLKLMPLSPPHWRL
jgi:hypothetical protein